MVQQPSDYIPLTPITTSVAQDLESNLLTLAVDAARARNTTLSQNARLLALLNMAATDSAMAANALAGGPRSVWLVHLTIGNRTVQLSELASSLLGAPSPEELALAEEASALGLLPRQGCPLCSSR